MDGRCTRSDITANQLSEFWRQFLPTRFFCADIRFFGKSWSGGTETVKGRFSLGCGRARELFYRLRLSPEVFNIEHPADGAVP
jgi:hypothetical protein